MVRMNATFPGRACLLAATIITMNSVTLPTSADEATALSSVGRRVQTCIELNEAAGAVTLVAGPDKVLDLSSVGTADSAAGKPMKPDTIFWIASMTKPITASAVMMLVEEGKLSIDDQVGKYLPELAHLKTADGVERIVTLKQLLTHSSGMPDLPPDVLNVAHTLADLVPHYLDQPLHFVPGSKWQYSQSGINTLGRIIEVVSGQPFQDFLQDRFFTPLGMNDTTFYPTAQQAARLAKSYRLVDGQLHEGEIFLLQGRPVTSRERYPAANGGLFSTAGDYCRFLQMILNDGQLDGRRYLRPESVRLMTSVQSGDLKTGFTPGNGWGLGWCVVRKPQGITAMLSPGSAGHGGVYGTQAWIDPQRRLIFILMIQRADLANSDGSHIREVFQQAAVDQFAGGK